MAKLYTVNEVVERTNITRQGKVEKIYRVSATSASGFPFTVDVPEANFSKEKVGDILTEKAALLEDIKKL